jgi:hypothetical protein
MALAAVEAAGHTPQNTLPLLDQQHTHTLSVLAALAAVAMVMVVVVVILHLP